MTASYQSLKDMGYQQARTADHLSTQAEFALATIKGFPEEVPAESRAELYAGYQLRYSETHPAVVYAVINGHYVMPSQEQADNTRVEKVEIGVAYAFSYSQQEFGKLASTNPALHDLVKKVREATNDYCSNRLGDLKRAAKKILTKGQKKTRETHTFVESMTKLFEAQAKSVKVKAGRGGDTTANEAKYKAAVAAFWKAYKV
jgi:hypothetical protein